MADHLAAELRAFRTRLHLAFDRRKDALFELNDAVLAAGTVPAPVHLSLQPAVHRRAWTSLEWRSPAEVLGFACGVRHREEELRRAFFSVRFVRFLDALGYTRFRHWRV